jgi:mannosyltransferase
MVFGLILKNIFRKKLAIVFTSASQRHHTKFTKALIRRMDFVIATSKKTASYLERDARVVIHGIDTDTFAPPMDKAALRRKIGLPDSGFIVGCFGRIRHQKGTDTFVQAMIYGVIMGRAIKKDLDFFNKLKIQVAEAGFSDRILFMPEVPVWEMPDWYKALDLYVAPQRWEGFGLTPLEAMSCGVPVVATKVGAFEELVVDGMTGQLIDADDASRMCQEIIYYFDDGDKIKGASDAARKHVVKNFKIEYEADRLNEIYKSLLAA